MQGARPAVSASEDPVGTWKPGAAPAGRTPDPSRLRAWAAAAADDAAAFVEAFPDPPEAHAWLAALDEQAWTPVVRELSDQELVALVRFFTLAEGRLPGWEAGERSPVVPMARELRRRGAFPQDLRRWVRAHSENRFLPFGSLQSRL